jgi:type II secretory pathway pseudopilin PulG
MASILKARHAQPRGEGGYILLTLMLVCALMAIAATVVITDIEHEIRRDREEEMVHRGVQYTRAIKAYYKKLGRYPTKLEDLDNTNNLRYLRKHYKDPENCKNGKCQDFKLLHYGDPGLSLGSGFGGGMIPGMSPAGSPGGLNGPGSSGSSFGSSSFGSSSGSSSFGGAGSGSGFGNSGVNSQGVFAQTGPGGNSNSSFGAGNNQGSSNTPGANPTSGDASQTGSGSQDSNSSQSGAGNSNGSSSPTGLGGQTFGGGPIVGVASLCKDKTIRIYNKKSKYNEWQFIYDPTADRGGLITTPYQPLQTLGSGGIPGAQPAGGNGNAFGNSGNGSSFGNSGSGNAFGNSGSSSFGSGSGFGNSSNGPASPPTNPPQQQ